MPKSEIVWKGLEELRPLLVAIGFLKSDPRNAMKHSERNISVIAHSLAKLGQHRLAVVTRDGTCIVGNGMLQAARALEWTHLAAVECDDDEATRKLRAITDNRSGSEDIGSEFDFPVLADILTDPARRHGVGDTEGKMWNIPRHRTRKDALPTRMGETDW